ncbi:MAG: outer membrane beta-barrel protein, partial [Proteiniphilum sp.]|nr:outer membrane beta-barrel protein [Proteiniphilum sp.]
PYDFSNDLRTFQWGAQIGGEYALKRNFNIFANLDYDFNNVFKSDFTAITFSMHNIYLNIGFGYKF